MAHQVRPHPGPYLLPNTDLFYWKGRIIHLPKNYIEKSHEYKKGFIELLNSLNIFSFKNLTQEQKEDAFGKAWHEIVKTLPDETFAKTVLKVVEIAGIAILFVIGTRACL